MVALLSALSEIARIMTHEILENMENLNASDSVLKEALKCLQEGFLREDWLLSAPECAEKAENATGTHERNYRLCMKQMASFKKKN